ncbi:MAG: dephospho-CoA kinase [Alistipes sp.]|nr:dephospho-CoA kinase [Alistipes sp.]
MLKIGVTGGIGSGKSTVCRLFAARGIAVYDTDAAAKRLMAEDAALRRAIEARFGEESYQEGALNRPWLARQVFGDEAALQALNRLVHPAVIADFERWATEQQSAYVVVESAILYEAGLDQAVDRVVAVLAPERLRIERAMQRDGATEEQIRSRIAAQLSDEELHRRADVSLVNIFEEDLEVAVQELDSRFRALAHA